jgi:rhamnogalacturonan endolyase
MTVDAAFSYAKTDHRKKNKLFDFWLQIPYSVRAVTPMQHCRRIHTSNARHPPLVFSPPLQERSMHRPPFKPATRVAAYASAIGMLLAACGGSSDPAATAAATSTTATAPVASAVAPVTIPVVTSTATPTPDSTPAPATAAIEPDPALLGTVVAVPATDAVQATAGVTLSAATTSKVPRVMENLGRGVVVLRKATKSALVSWRLLGLDPAGIGFNVYRSANGATAVKLNGSTPLTAGTNFDDTQSDFTVANTYTVRPVIGGVEQAASGAFTLPANNTIEPVVRIPLKALPGADYATKFAWVGDLDGDGEYDYVIDRLAPFRADNNDYGVGNQFLEAYKRDGTRLWQIDLGPSSTYTYNISPGATTLSMGMYDGVTVYDLDGDGKAEVILKVANGVKFGNGTTFTNADPEQQFIAVLDGQKGTPLATHAFPNNFYAAAGRLGTQLGIGYPDGVNPTIYFWGRNRNKDKSFNDVFASWSWKGGSTITQNWVLPLSGGTSASHQMRIIDLDGDGKDEMATGNFAINSNGTLRYVLPGVGHGDRFYLGKMDAASTDIQGYGIQQDNPSGLLEYYYNATTGKIQWTHSTTAGTLVDVGRGLAADIDTRYPGFETWSFSGVYNGPSGKLTQSSTTAYPWPSQLVWWDADTLSEITEDAVINKWVPTTGTVSRVLTMYHTGAYGYGHNALFIGDILGDWRTEQIMVAKGGTELQIFSSDIPTTVRAYTMAQNPAYRNHMTLKGYLQSPMLDYYFGNGMGTPPVPNIRYAGLGTIPAETAVLAGGSTIKADRNGFNGSGFVDFPTTGGSVTFNYIKGAGANKTVTIRYANGSATARTGVLKLNGVAQNVTFPSTGGWTNWSTLNVTLKLASGTANKISIESNGQGLANIDELTVP